MPTKERYRKLVLQENKCPRCGKLRDNRNFVECSQCRKRGTTLKADIANRVSAMSLFIPPSKAQEVAKEINKGVREKFSRKVIYND